MKMENGFIDHRKNHIAVSIDYSAEKSVEITEFIKQLIEFQIKQDITILSIECNMPEQELNEFLRFYVKKKYLDDNRIKLSFIGKWYDLSSKTVELIKDLVNATRDYSKYFLNFVVNYDGQEEIVDACKILCRQIIGEKIDIEKIDKMQLKDNMYTSYFVPPDAIIRISKDEKLNGFLLWDSFHSEIKFIKELSIEKLKELI